jgi:hypothetical protein
VRYRRTYEFDADEIIDVKGHWLYSREQEQRTPLGDGILGGERLIPLKRLL